MTFWDFYHQWRRFPYAVEGVRGLELLRRIGVSGPAGRAPCRICGRDGCADPGHLRALLAEEESAAFRQRLRQHAAAAARDAATRRNGHAR